VSEKYRLMIYFAVATVHFYRGSLDVDATDNKALIARVCEEARNLFGYDLSSEQISRALTAYRMAAQSVEATEAATL
jgi:hypothetical protein